MIVQVYGKQFVRLQYGDMVIAYNPPAAESGAKTTKFGSDIALCSMRTPDYYGIETVTYGDKEPFVIDGPGAYEVQELPVTGVETWHGEGDNRHLNTVYAIELEEMKIVFLGSIDKMDALSADERDRLGDADIVFASLGTGLPPSKVYSLAKSFSPSYIVAIGDGADDELVRKVFLDEANQSGNQSVDKWTIKPRDLIGKEAEVVIIQS